VRWIATEVLVLVLEHELANETPNNSILLST
jgi:hypothetical protein